MLSPEDLKSAIQSDKLTRADRVIFVLSSLAQPASLDAIRIRAVMVGFPMDKWNITDILNKSKYAIRVPAGYEVSEKGFGRLEALGVTRLPAAAAKVAQDLRKHLANINDDTTHAFVEEAIRCHEASLYRSAIVMSWLAAVGVLQNMVITKHLTAFNAESKKVDVKWKTAATTNDLGRRKEADFLDRIVAIGVIGKNVKTELVKGLNLRNGCGHPNSLKVSTNQVAAHIELLLLNVFDVFAV